MRTDFEEHVLESLRAVVTARPRRMFGGMGIKSGGLSFALIMNDVLYFKVDDSTRPDYEARGMRPFQPRPGQVSRSYFELPQDVLASKVRLGAWVVKAIDAARAKSKSKKQTKKSSSSEQKIPNLDRVSKRRLAEIGVDSLADLEKKGSVATFLAVKKRGHAPTSNLLYTLEGALLGLPRDRLPDVVKQNLRRRAGLG